MYCDKCGKEVSEGAIFCSYCGTKLPAGEESANRKEPKDGPIDKRIKPLISPPNLLYILLLIFAPIPLHFYTAGSKGIQLAAETIAFTSPALLTVIVYNYIKGENKAVKWVSAGISIFLLTAVAVSLVGLLLRNHGAKVAASDTTSQQTQASSPVASPPIINVNVTRLQSITLNVSQPMQRVHLADPRIADIKVLTPTEVEVTGKSEGVTPLAIWDKSGQRTLFSINVQ